MKALFIIIDGVSDRPNPELDGKTPMQYAETPNLDKLAALSITGLHDPIAPGVVPGSDTAHLALFGVDPLVAYTGRGPFEAAGIGMDVKAGDVAFRANFATVDENRIIVSRRAGRIKEGTHELVSLLEGQTIEGVKVLIGKGTEHRCAVVLRGKGISADVTMNDPKVDGKPIKQFKPTADSDEARLTASVLTKFVEFAERILPGSKTNADRLQKGKLAANTMLVRGAGVSPHLPDFSTTHGLNAVCVAGGGLYKGVARMVGMDILEVPGATGGLDTDLDAKVNAATRALEKYNFVFLHVKATDNLGHDGNAVGKAEFLAKVDKAFAPLISLPDDTVILVTGDHSTPCPFKDHSADPVPIMLRGKQQRLDDVIKFDEYSVVRGGLGRILGIHIMPILINEMRLGKKFGA